MKYLFISFLLLASLSSFGATIEVSDMGAEKIWKSIDVISKIENLEIIKTNATESNFKIDDISCVFENYDACSFFTDIKNERKMVVAMEGTNTFMQSLADVGILVDEENARMDVESVECSRMGNEFNCTIEEYIP
jgi:hypothetical protein